MFNFVWGNDNKTVYYTRSTDVLRPHQVWAHQVGTPQESDVLVFQEDDDSIFIDVGSTKDQRFVTINGNSLSSSEVRVLDAGHDFSAGALPELTVIAPRAEGVEYYVDHHDVRSLQGVFFEQKETTDDNDQQLSELTLDWRL